MTETLVTSLRSQLAEAQAEIARLRQELDQRARAAFVKTEQLQAALDAQREVDEYLREVYNVMPGALLVVDSKGAVCAVNDETSKLLGYGRAELDGRPAATLFDGPGGMGPEEIATLTALTAVHRSERVCRTRAGERVPVLFSAASLGARFNAPGFVCVITDLRERKRLEGELTQAQKLESVGRLAAGVAHELNTPIQFVGDSVHFVRDALDDVERLVGKYHALVDAVRQGCAAPELADELQEAEQDADIDYLFEHMPKALERAIEGLERVTHIVRSLKTFAHPDSAEKTHADLNQALQTTLVIARNEYKYVADVETDFGELPSVPCYPSEINQVFLNLIVNAAHAIADAVENGSKRGTITIRTRCENQQAVISIGDTGTGVAERHRDKLFDQFFTTKPVGKGTGQGLALARSAITKHGGSIDFETELGRGTTFFVRLPLDG